MKMKQWFIGLLALLVLVVCLFCLVPSDDVTAEAGNGRPDLYYNGFSLGGSVGTKIDLLVAKQLVFTGDTSCTTSLTGALPGETYLYFDGWSSRNAITTGTVTTYVVTTGTVTATTSFSTTGTLNLLILSLL